MGRMPSSDSRGHIDKRNWFHSDVTKKIDIATRSLSFPSLLTMVSKESRINCKNAKPQFVLFFDSQMTLFFKPQVSVFQIGV